MHFDGNLVVCSGGLRHGMLDKEFREGSYKENSGVRVLCNFIRV